MGTVERVILPDDAWADVRDPKKVPERLRRPVREAAINLQRSIPEDQRKSKVVASKTPDVVADDDTQAAFGAPPVEALAAESEDKAETTFLPTIEQQRFVDAYNEALLMSVVTGWSFGEVTIPVLQDIPGDAMDELLEAVRKLGANEENGDSLASDPS